MLREHTNGASASGVTRLVDAERTWQQSLAAARASADATVAEAEAEAQRAESTSRCDIERAVGARRAELESALAAAVRDEELGLAGRADRYTNASDALIEELARQALAHAPWFVAAEDVS